MNHSRSNFQRRLSPPPSLQVFLRCVHRCLTKCAPGADVCVCGRCDARHAPSPSLSFRSFSLFDASIHTSAFCRSLAPLFCFFVCARVVAAIHPHARVHPIVRLSALCARNKLAQRHALLCIAVLRCHLRISARTVRRGHPPFTPFHPPTPTRSCSAQTSGARPTGCGCWRVGRCGAD